MVPDFRYQKFSSQLARAGEVRHDPSLIRQPSRIIVATRAGGRRAGWSEQKLGPSWGVAARAGGRGSGQKAIDCFCFLRVATRAGVPPMRQVNASRKSRFPRTLFVLTECIMRFTSEPSIWYNNLGFGWPSGRTVTILAVGQTERLNARGASVRPAKAGCWRRTENPPVFRRGECHENQART